MSILDKLKGVINAVTGGAARVRLLYGPQLLFPGDEVKVGVSVTSTGGQVRSNGLFIDLCASEIVDFKDASDNHIRYEQQTFYRELQVAPSFVLGPGEERSFDVPFTVPPDVTPSFQGKLCRHTWQIRARIAIFGNDPGSGWIDTRVGIRE